MSSHYYWNDGKEKKEESGKEEKSGKEEEKEIDLCKQPRHRRGCFLLS